MDLVKISFKKNYLKDGQSKKMNGIDRVTNRLSKKIDRNINPWTDRLTDKQSKKIKGIDRVTNRLSKKIE